MAAFLVACEPSTPSFPTGQCDNLPACSALDYGFYIESDSFEGYAPDTSIGDIPIGKLGFRILVTERFASTPVACLKSGRSGYAFASSCLPCSGKYFQADSLYFTTDILTLGDTLKAGYNFAKGVIPQSFQKYGMTLEVRYGFPTRFKDSVFEVRFSGLADSVKKSGSITLHITNPALLF